MLMSKWELQLLESQDASRNTYLCGHMLSDAPGTVGCDFRTFTVTWKEPL